MIFKMTSIIFTMLIILAMFGQTSAGPAAGFCCYWSCMALCTGGAGLFAGVMTAGVATPAGMAYGAAACATMCSALTAAVTVLPTP
ncbi:unnamed protein product [Rotaria sp. Silwood2]|nr:unnamed protein product [Rotaria sp. Silwood2]CAF4214169.1 unnamed protein product [Rotaria sp. Silwood2]